MTPEQHDEDAYELFRKGSELLEAGDFMAASIPLERARQLEPDKSSIREALGRAYFRSARFEQAAEEFAAVVERHPVDDYAHFCLGRSLANTGRTAEAAGTRPWPPTCAQTARTTGRSQSGCARPEPRRRAPSPRPRPPAPAVGPRRARRGPARNVAVHPDVARARASEANDARLAVPPAQHPGVELAAAVQRDRLGAQEAVRHPQAHVQRLAVELLAGHGDAPLAVREPPGPQRRQPFT